MNGWNEKPQILDCWLWNRETCGWCGRRQAECSHSTPTQPEMFFQAALCCFLPFSWLSPGWWCGLLSGSANILLSARGAEVQRLWTVSIIKCLFLLTRWRILHRHFWWKHERSEQKSSFHWIWCWRFLLILLAEFSLHVISQKKELNLLHVISQYNSFSWSDLALLK